MTFKDVKELSKFVETCAKLGIKELKVGELHCIFGDTPTQVYGTDQRHTSLTVPKEIVIPRKTNLAADAIEHSAKRDEVNQEKEDELAISLVISPESYEDSMIEELLDGTKDTRSE